MKNLFFLLILASNIVSGQETLRKFRFGLRVTPVISWIKPDFRNLPDNFGVEGGGARLGFVWGPTAEFFLNETFLFSTGADLNYSSFKLKGNNQGKPWEQTYKNRFIDIPLMLKFRTKEIGYFRYFGLFGITNGFNLSSKTEFYDGSSLIRDQTKKYIQGFRGSISVGGGLEYNFLGNTSLVTSLVFNNGVTNILKNYSDGFSKDIRENGINNYFMLNFGILF